MFGQQLSEIKPREKGCNTFSQPRKQNEAPRRGTILAVRSHGHDNFSRSLHETPRGSRPKSPREGPRKSLRESPREIPLEGPRESSREGSRGIPHDSASDQPESARGNQRDNSRTYPPPVIHSLSSECPLCSRPHALSSCETFKRKSYQERLELMF